MELILRKTIGQTEYSFIVQGKNLWDLVMESQKLSFHDIHACGLCKSDNLGLTAYETPEEGYKYVKIVCWKCKASLTFGQPKKSPDTFYLRKNDDKTLAWEPFVEKKQ